MHSYIFAVTVEGLDVSDGVLMARLDEVAEILVVAEVDGVVSVHVDIEAASADDAVRGAVHLLEGAIHGLTVLQIDLDLVGATDLAERVGVSRQAVAKWTSAGLGGNAFPAPLGHLAGGTRVWAWSTVLPWLHASGHATDEHTIDYRTLVTMNALLQRPPGSSTDCRTTSMPLMKS